MTFFRAWPVLDGIRRYVDTAWGRREKALAEAGKWIERNKLAGESWTIEVESFKE
jgi:hypothetical protein